MKNIMARVIRIFLPANHPLSNANKILGWTPRTDLETSLKITLDAFVEEARLYNNRTEGQEIY